MPNLEEGFKLALNLYTNSTNGVNKVVVLTNIFNEVYNLVASNITEYNAATTKINLTLALGYAPSESQVEAALLAQSPSNYALYIAEEFTDSTIIRVDDGTGYTYWKAYYLTRQSLTFGAATANAYGGSIVSSNTPLTFDIIGGHIVQAVGLYHNETKVAYALVSNATDANNFQYVIDSVTINLI